MQIHRTRVFPLSLSLLSLVRARSFARDSVFAHFCNLCTLERVRVTSLTTARNFLLGFRQTGEIEIPRAPVKLSPS